MKPAAALFVALALVPHIADAATSRARYLMGTVCEVAVADHAESEIELAFAEAKRIESFLSTWIPASELSRVNRGEAEPSEELRALLATAVAWSEKTNGAFDPRVKALIEAWKMREEGAVPSDEAIARALCGRAPRCHPERSEGSGRAGARVGSHPPSSLADARDDERQDDNRCAFEEGAFGKGYALDRMLAVMQSPEVLIDFGGQLAVRGSKVVAIADPSRRDAPVFEFTLTNASLSTSSGSEKTFVANGRRFSHLIDPRSGQALPPRGSASVVAREALAADILSTALYVMGEEEGLRWADANGVAVIFINDSNQIRLSAPARAVVRDPRVLSRQFTLKD